LVTLFPGAIIDGRYAVLALLGEGATGVVYKAKHQLMNRIVVVRMLPAELAADQDTLEIFRQEAKSVSGLTHPNIVGIHDFGVTTGGEAYLVTDFLSGSSLSDRLNESGAFPWQQALSVFKQMCSVLAYAHKNGVIHRDLRPKNIVLVESDSGFPVVKVTDFAVGKSARPSPAEAEQLLPAAEASQSLPYMSPEQILGRNVDQRSDIYALGCVIYECLAGRPPFLGDSAAETISKQLSQKPPALGLLPAESKAPEWLEQLVSKCLAKDPAKRWQSMADLSEELSKRSGAGGSDGQGAIFNEQASIGQQNDAAGKARPSRRSGAAAAIAVSGAFVVLLIGLLAWAGELPIVCAWTKLKLAEQSGGAQSSRLLAAMLELERLDEGKQRYSEAADLCRRLLAAAESSSGPTSLAAAEAMIRLANVYNCQGRSADAAEYCGKAFQICQKNAGRKATDQQRQTVSTLLQQLLPVARAGSASRARDDLLARALGLAGEFASRAKDFEQARVFLEEALVLHKRVGASRREDKYWSALNLADVYRETNRLQAAESLYKEVSNQFLERFGPTSAYTAQTFHNFAFCYAKQNKYAEAVEMMSKVVEINKNADLRTQFEQLLPTLEQMLNMMEQGGVTDNREKICKQMIELERKKSGRARDVSLIRLVEIYHDEKKFAECERQLKDVLTRVNQPDVTPEVLNRLGIYYAHKNQPELAIDTFKRAASILRQDQNCNKLFRAQVLYALAVTQVSLKHYQEAVPAFEEAIAIAEKESGNAKEIASTIMIGLADCFGRLGSDSACESYLKRAVAVLEPVSGRPDQAFFAAVFALSAFYWKHQRLDELEKNLQRILPYCQQNSNEVNCIECLRQQREVLARRGGDS
jgi:tetratricopeptide (TPR) repeat protein